MDLLPKQPRSGLGNFVTATSITPINDLKGPRPSSYTEGESQLRCKVAALYRLMDLCGWSHGIYNHISAKLDSAEEHFLLNPFGMLYSEITASTLVKVDLNGKMVAAGSSPFGVNQAGWTIHSAIHGARPEVKCVVHLHAPAIVAVASMKCGLLRLCHEALALGEVTYHDYQGIVIDQQEKEELIKNLGRTSKVLMLRNHGVAICGDSVEETFHLTFYLMAACEQQMKAMQGGLENVIVPNEDAPKTQNHLLAMQGAGGSDSQGTKWGPGQLEFEALMRTLDNMGYRTGYDYKLLPLAKTNGSSTV